MALEIQFHRVYARTNGSISSKYIKEKEKNGTKGNGACKKSSFILTNNQEPPSSSAALLLLFVLFSAAGGATAGPWPGNGIHPIGQSATPSAASKFTITPSNAVPTSERRRALLSPERWRCYHHTPPERAIHTYSASKGGSRSTPLCMHVDSIVQPVLPVQDTGAGPYVPAVLQSQLL